MLSTNKTKYADNYNECGDRKEIIQDRIRVASEIEKYLKEGLPFDNALQIVRLDPARWGDWLHEGKHQNFLGDMRWIVGLVECCETHFQREILNNIIDKSQKDWKAAAWILEHRFRREWGNDIVPVETDKDTHVIFTASIGRDGTVTNKLSSDITKKLILDAVDASTSIPNNDTDTNEFV